MRIPLSLALVVMGILIAPSAIIAAVRKLAEKSASKNVKIEKVRWG